MKDKNYTNSPKNDIDSLASQITNFENEVSNLTKEEYTKKLCKEESEKISKFIKEVI